MSDLSEPKDTKGEREPEEIRADIEQTREELGNTAAAVAEKADVKGQAAAKADEVKGKAKEVTGQAAAKAKEVAPDSAAPAIEKAQKFAGEKPLVAIGVVLVAVVILRRLLSR